MNNHKLSRVIRSIKILVDDIKICKYDPFVIHKRRKARTKQLQAYAKSIVDVSSILVKITEEKDECIKSLLYLSLESAMVQSNAIFFQPLPNKLHKAGGVISCVKYKS